MGESWTGDGGYEMWALGASWKPTSGRGATLNPLGDNDQIKGRSWTRLGPKGDRSGDRICAGYGSKNELESGSQLPNS